VVGIPTFVTLIAAGCLLSAVVMAVLWAWQRRARNAALTDAVWTALVAGLAILDANLGDGAWSRRSAIGWMMGSWGARLVVYRMYAPADGVLDRRDSFWSYQGLAVSALFFSLPALLASINPAPTIAIADLIAGGLWVVGFAGETTADRQLLRFRSKPANAGLVCRTGLWRYTQHPDAIFEGMIWLAFALIAGGSPDWPWGWAAFACPAAMMWIRWHR